ncbi:hypothetical protein PMAYCL1PPCAC_02638 [Pristionchus mayeri]|uniref:Clc-5 n=1 Tax=Pristionchus mayeri TaxID=1317129 RepID=A0AAN4Z5R9_9BILA|nr:hypothetical protein PMAYCL1PPCAC_02638 [Pristionchus mayeri]
MALPSPSSPKVLIQIPSFVFALLGFILVWISLATPAWQVTYARELRQWIQSGLWITCQTRPSGMYACTWMFSQSDFDFYNNPDVASYRTPSFYQWQRTLLHIFLAVQLCVLIALISFCVSNSSGKQKCSVIVFTLFMVIATLTSFVLLVSFLVLSHMVEYRFYTVSVSGIYEKHIGYSFYLALVGSIFYFISICFSVVYLIRILSDSSASGGLQRMAKGNHSQSTAYTYNSRDDYRMATSNDDLDPTFSFQPSYRSSHQFNSSIDQHFAMKPLPATPQSFF